jgi:hypothetical protein
MSPVQGLPEEHSPLEEPDEEDDEAVVAAAAGVSDVVGAT